MRTLRGCYSKIPLGTEKFFNCDTNGCNKGIFPEERMKCVKCSAEDEFCVTPTADLLYPCKNYIETDSCYTFVIGEIAGNIPCWVD
jgi:Protein of unknown function (DUF753)